MHLRSCRLLDLGFGALHLGTRVVRQTAARSGFPMVAGTLVTPCQSSQELFLAMWSSQGGSGFRPWQGTRSNRTLTGIRPDCHVLTERAPVVLSPLERRTRARMRNASSMRIAPARDAHRLAAQ
jgi:hypothetical protein